MTSLFLALTEVAKLYLNFNLKWMQNQQFLICHWVKEKKRFYISKSFQLYLESLDSHLGQNWGVVDLGNQKGRVEKFLNILTESFYKGC